MSCLEALLGTRALHQIRPLMAPEAFRALSQYRRPALERVELGTVRMQMPHAGALEACATICWRGRWLVCVLRLDAGNTSMWTCTQLEVVGR